MHVEHLFVYGSLAKGQKNAYILEKIGGKWRPASIIGRLVDRGWGADIGYPGLHLDENGQVIEGHLFSSSNLNDHWKRLDEFEGAEYERVLTEVNVGKEPIEAFVYILR